MRNRDVDTILQALLSDELTDETMASLWSRTPLDEVASFLKGFRSRQDSGDQTQVPRAHEASISESSIGEGVDTTSHVLQSPITASHSSHYSATYVSIRRDRGVFFLMGQERRLTGVENHLTIFKSPKERWVSLDSSPTRYRSF